MKSLRLGLASPSHIPVLVQEPVSGGLARTNRCRIPFQEMTSVPLHAQMFRNVKYASKDKLFSLAPGRVITRH